MLNLLVVEPGKEPVERKVENSLQALQELVGGYIETVAYGPYTILCDEDGKLKNLPKNRIGLVGTLVFTKASHRSGNYVSLSAADVSFLGKHLKGGV